MKAAIDRFLRYLKEERESAENTVLAYAADVQQFEQVLSGGGGRPVRVAAITSAMVGDYARWLERQGYQPSTVSRKMAAARALLQYLGEHEGLSIARLLEQLRPPVAPRSLPKTLTRTQIGQLIEAPRQLGTPRGLRDSALLSLLYSAGLRASETVGLNVGDIDLRDGTLRKPDGTELRLQMSEAEVPLRNYLSTGRPFLLKRESEPALFLNLRGKRLSRQGLWLVVKRWSASIGIQGEISPHSLRHSLIRHLLEQGKSRREIQELLGLSSPNAIRIRPS